MLSMEERSNQARFGKFSNGSKSQASLASISNLIQNAFSRYSQKLQFKGTEIDLNGTESVENQKLSILSSTASCLLLAQLSLFKGALKQLK